MMQCSKYSIWGKCLRGRNPGFLVTCYALLVTCIALWSLACKYFIVFFFNVSTVVHVYFSN